MVTFDPSQPAFIGDYGTLSVLINDYISQRLAMLIEGECTELGPAAAANKYGYTKQRYYQLRRQFYHDGAMALAKQRTGPKTNYRRTTNVVCQVVRHRFLDPEASPEIIAQKLTQTGTPISISSVKRVVAEFGLQKKTLHVPA